MDRRRMVLAAVTVLAVVGVSAAAATVGSDANLGTGPGQTAGDGGGQSDTRDSDRVLPTLGNITPWGGDERGASGNGSDGVDADAGSGPAGPTQITSPAVGFAGILVVGVAIAFAAYHFGRSEDEDSPAPDDEGDTEPDEDGDESLQGVGRAAGEAAASLTTESSPANAIERAWRDMTTELAVTSPETATPWEFAGAAVAAGMREEDVEELTALFEEVRYGDAEPTEDRVERATAALRRIERRYGE